MQQCEQEVSPVSESGLGEGTAGPRTSLSQGVDAADERRDGEVADAEFVAEKERPLVTLQEPLNLTDALEERGSSFRLALHRHLVPRRGDDVGEAVRARRERGSGEAHRCNG